MSFQVKLPFGKSSGSLQTCVCGFSTRHDFLFTMHTKRCKPPKKKPSKLGLNAGIPLKRNYKCEHCSFNTNKSRLFLCHQVQLHNADILVYPCDLCQYATRYKHKMPRHRAMIHRDAPPLVIRDLEPLKPPFDLEAIRKADDSPDDFVNEVQIPTDNPGSRGNVTNTLDDSTLETETTTQSKYIKEIWNKDHSETKYQCKLCPFVNSQRWMVQKHMKSVHLKGSVYNCDRCSFKTNRKIEFSIHRAQHAKNPQLTCGECRFSCSLKDEMDEHNLHHTNSYAVKCHLCSFSANTSMEIENHQEEHHSLASPEKLFGIDTAMTLSDVTNNNTEEAIDMSPQRYATPSHGTPSGSSPPSSSNRSSSKEPCPEILCPICGLSLPNETHLRSHIVLHPKFQPWACPICKSRYRRSSDLSRHLKRKHGRKIKEFPRKVLLIISNKVDDADSQPVSKTDEQPLDLSLKNTVRKALFVNENLKCKHCSYMAKWPADLKRHMLVHKVDRRFFCQHCNKSYKYKFDLNMHMRKSHRAALGLTRQRSNGGRGTKQHRKYVTSSGGNGNQILDQEKPELRCVYCPYIGTCKSEVDRHTMLHTGEKPFHCMFCQYKTLWKGDMKRHLAKHHGDHVNEHNLVQMTEQTYKPDIEQQSQQIKQQSLSEEVEMGEVGYEGNAGLPEEAMDTSDPQALYGASVYEAGMFESDTVVVIPEAPEETLRKQQHQEQLTLDQYLKIQNQSPASHSNYSTKGTASPVTSPGLNSNILVKDDPTTGKKVVCCPKCPFTCEAQSKLKSHMTIHDNLKPYKCGYCGKRSNWLWDVRKHIKKDHPGDNYKNVELMSESEARATIEDYISSSAHRTVKVSPFEPTAIPNDTPSQVMPGSVFAMQGIHGGSPVSKGKSNSSFSTPAKSEGTPSPKLTPNYKKMAPEERFRPFKCTVCGKRSNWKHDIQKHIRMVHNEKGSVITLSLEEAKATYSKPEYKRRSGSLGKAFSTPSPTQTIGHKPGPSPASEDGLGKWNGIKRFQCPGCVYRSDYSGDISRHIVRKHSDMPDAKVIILDYEEAVSTLNNYHYDWIKNRAPPKEGSNPKGGKKKGKLVKKSWKCSRCDFRDVTKEVVVEHFKTEHAKRNIYGCRQCDFVSIHRSAAQRHIREKHGSTDYNQLFLKENGASVPSGVKKISKKEYDSLQYKGMYKCLLCKFSAKWQKPAVKHVQIRHPECPFEKCIKLFPKKSIREQLLKTETQTPPPPPPVEAIVSPAENTVSDLKKTRCQFCPYQAASAAKLQYHVSHHKKTPEKKFACKYCPYYVCARRLLNQHVRMHLNDPKGVWAYSHLLPSSPGKKGVTLKKKTADKTAKKTTRYFCDKCPYVGKCLNDYLYHKQFHRPKANAPFKCDECPYWTTLRRLLTQHKKVHNPQYKLKYEQGDSIPGEKKISMVETSPTKTEISDSSYTSIDAIQMARIKQHIIAAKIKSVPVSPASVKQHKLLLTPKRAMKDNSDPSMMYGCILNETGNVLTSGMYKKLHQCRFCPYTNIRGTNVRLHEKMHGPRQGKDVFKCMYCDYHVANKGLLSHHIKVHSSHYNPYQDVVNDVEMPSSSDAPTPGEGDVKVEPLSECSSASSSNAESQTSVKVDQSAIPGNTSYYIKFNERTGEHRLESIRFKKWCCERCPYATAKQPQFERHMQLHGSKQKYECEYCDYSVPSYNLLLQHKQLHLAPNNNLLINQSISNLVQLPEIPANVAAAANYPVLEKEDDRNLLHDHLDLYENSDEYMEPKKLYCCDRCPYANVRRDHLLSHLRCHVIRSSLQCPYCDYSVTKQQLLQQHVKIHFSSALINGSTFNDSDESDDAPDAVPLTTEDAPSTKEDSQDQKEPEFIDISELVVPEGTETDDASSDMTDEMSMRITRAKENAEKVGEVVSADGELNNNESSQTKGTVWVCQYCDRPFQASEKLVQHEMQHLIGNKV